MNATYKKFSALTLALMASAAMASDATGTLNVSLAVDASCQITGTGSVTFGAFNALNTAAIATQSTGMSYACTTGTAPAFFITGDRHIVGANTASELPVLFMYNGQSVGETSSAAISLSSTNGSVSPLSISAQVNNVNTAPADSYNGAFTVHLSY